jgi:hypothetical protein
VNHDKSITELVRSAKTTRPWQKNEPDDKQAGTTSKQERQESKNDERARTTGKQERQASKNDRRARTTSNQEQTNEYPSTPRPSPTERRLTD